MTENPIQVLLIDRHEVFRAGLRYVLDKHDEMEVVGEADTVAVGVTSIESLKPNVVVLDVSIADDACEVVHAACKAHSPETCIVGLSGHRSRHWAERSLNAGCAGYLDKTAGIIEIVPAISAISRGRMIISLPRHEPPTMPVADPVATGPPGPHVELLSDREREVLQCLARGQTNQQAADDLFLSVKTVETYRSRMTRKLGLRGRAELFEYAKSNGLLADATAR